MYFEKSCPWKDHLFDIEEETDKKGLIKYVFFKDERGMIRVQAMSDAPGSFGTRMPLHQDWRGLRGPELATISGFEDIEFVHHAGFIGGAWSLETAIKMAEQSVHVCKLAAESKK